MSWYSTADEKLLPEVDEKGRRRVYNIHIDIDEVSKEEAYRRLKEVVQEITEEGWTDCSAHDDTFIPYTHYCCQWMMKHEG